MTKFVLYGIAGASDGYRIVKYDFYEGAIYDTKPIKAHAGLMRFNNPTIEHVYLVSPGTELATDYRKTIKQNSVEANVIFKLTLERDGFMVI